MGITDLSAHSVPSVTKSTNDTIDQLCVNPIRTLAIDAVQAANSGHPGTPMALASVVYCLWQRVLRFDPNHPIWPNRDRSQCHTGPSVPTTSPWIMPIIGLVIAFLLVASSAYVIVSAIGGATVDRAARTHNK
jgi:Transketolase, thiamine diphosphate binding domain